MGMLDARQFVARLRSATGWEPDKVASPSDGELVRIWYKED